MFSRDGLATFKEGAYFYRRTTQASPVGKKALCSASCVDRVLIEESDLWRREKTATPRRQTPCQAMPLIMARQVQGNKGDAT